MMVHLTPAMNRYCISDSQLKSMIFLPLIIGLQLDFLAPLSDFVAYFTPGFINLSSGFLLLVLDGLHVSFNRWHFAACAIFAMSGQNTFYLTSYYLYLLDITAIQRFLLTSKSDLYAWRRKCMNFQDLKNYLGR